MQFEGEELDTQWNERSGSLNNAYFEAECKDTGRLWDEDICRLEVVLKRLNTSLKFNEDVHRPLYFELLGIHLNQEFLGARLSGSQIQWIPSVENEVLNFLCTVLPSPKQPR